MKQKLKSSHCRPFAGYKAYAKLIYKNKKIIKGISYMTKSEQLKDKSVYHFAQEHASKDGSVWDKGIC